MGNGASMSKHVEEERSIMPMMFRKKSVNKKVLQEKLRLAAEKPDSIFDLAECGVAKVPEGVFSKCKFLNKQALMLQHNLIEDLKNGGQLADLANLLVLDLSHNHLKILPKEIKSLVSLQRLDISHNKIKKLPDEVGGMKALQELNCSDNDLSGLPSSIKYFRHLNSLNIMNNKYFSSLPVNLCFLTKLTDFKFDADKITYPKREFTSQGIQEIQRFFKMLKGEEYFSQDKLDSAIKASSPMTSPLQSPLPQDDGAFEESIFVRERKKQLEMEKRLRVEQEILESTEDNAKLVANASDQRNRLMSDIEKNEIEAQTALARQFDSENQERNKLLEQLYLEDNQETVNIVMSMSNRRKKTDDLLEELEQEQHRIDDLVMVTQEELDRLRRQEMIEAMTYVLNETAQNKLKFEEYNNSKKKTIAKSMKREEEDQEDLEKVLKLRDEEQIKLVQAVLTEEEKQRSAFQMLQFQKDSRLTRIKKQVGMIEAELARLSLLEIKKRQEKNVDDVNTLAEMRIQTAVLLSQLMDEQERREERLKKTITKMEEEKDDTAKDFWLIQFQRLMDSKPQILIDEENKLDVFVVEVLLHSNAKEYLPHFARNHVTEADMNQMTIDRLKEIGVKDSAKADSIMANLDSSRALNSKLVEKQEKLMTPTSANKDNPLPPTFYPASDSSAPPAAMDICTESECVVCLESQPTIVFLACGHVCCCATCCQPIDVCPLCRQPIIQKCRLFRSL